MKRLYRSRKDKIIAGVCAGIGEYFDIDPVIIRIIAIVLTFWGGSGILAYIIAMVVIPLAPESDTQTPEKKTAKSKAAAVPEEKPVKTTESAAGTGALIAGVVLILLGGIFLLRNFPFFDHYYWWFRHQIGHIFWPALLIIFGTIMIVRGSRK